MPVGHAPSKVAFSEETASVAAFCICVLESCLLAFFFFLLNSCKKIRRSVAACPRNRTAGARFLASPQSISSVSGRCGVGVIKERADVDILAI